MTTVEEDMSTSSSSSSFSWKYCRLCGLELRNAVSIFGREGRRLGIAEKIRKTVSILVLEEDNLPKRICTECCSRLEDYSEYKETVLGAQARLTEISRSPNRHDLKKSTTSSKSLLHKALVSSPSKGGGQGSTSRKTEHGHNDEEDLSPASSSSASEDDSWNLQCGICGSPSGGRADLESHHDKNHNLDSYPVPMYGCYYCPRISENYNALRLHVYRHMKEGSFKCDECDKSYSLRGQLERHVSSVHRKRLQKRGSVSVSANRRRGSSSLGAATNGDDSQMVEEAEEHHHHDDIEQDDVSPPSSYPCPSSPVACSPLPLLPPTTDTSSGSGGGDADKKEKDADETGEELLVQMGDNHRHSPEVQVHGDVVDVAVGDSSPGKGDDKSNPETEKPTPTADDDGFWKCQYCNKQYKSLSGYELHVSIHAGKRFECEFCDKSYTQKTALTHHIASHHKKTPKEFKCDVCTKEFCTSKLLRRHKRLHTEPSKESKCEKCGKVFRSQLHLKAHLKLHSAKKNFRCEACGKSFLNQYKLTIHENSAHTGARTLQCPHCDYAARTPGPFYRHLKKKHKTESSKKESPKKSTVPLGAEGSQTNSSSHAVVTSSSQSTSSPTKEAGAIVDANFMGLTDLSCKNNRPDHHGEELHMVTVPIQFGGGNNHSSASHPPSSSQSVYVFHPPSSHAEQSSSSMPPASDHHYHPFPHGQHLRPPATTTNNPVFVSQSLVHPPTHQMTLSSSLIPNAPTPSSSWVPNSSSKTYHPTTSLVSSSVDFDTAVQHAFGEGLPLHPQTSAYSHNSSSSSSGTAPYILAQQNMHHAHSTSNLHCSTSMPSGNNTNATNSFASHSSGGHHCITILSNEGPISTSTSSTNGHRQSQPMELSYKLQMDNSNCLQDMPMELTKVFQRDPLDLREINQLMDLSSRVGGGGTSVNVDAINMTSIPTLTLHNNNCMGLGSYHKELTDRELSFNDLSGAFRQPIDLIARPEDSSSHELCSEGSLVDLSLRSCSSFVPDQSSFLRELIDLSARSDSFQGEVNLTSSGNSSNNTNSPSKTSNPSSHGQIHHHNNNSSQQSHHPHHHSSSSTSTSTTSGRSNTLPTVIYQDAMFNI